MVAKNFFQSSMFSDKSLSYSPLLVSHMDIRSARVLGCDQAQ